MRQHVSCAYIIKRGFNPRICKRCDRYAIGLKAEAEVSIHASVKDATHCFHHRSFERQVSIHASVKDATNKPISFGAIGSVSIHASVKDATHLDHLKHLIFIVSIHASVKDATHSTCLIVLPKEFQSTHL